ncbi:MAG TPA: AsmA-like C-terminal region-containing protein, partial [Terriglobales bacterium]|nr:AsmA-like C-terminal region-containing protein [Terriglobales bacterium]
YHFDLEGDAELQRLLQLGGALGLRPPKLTAAGGARVSLQVDGRWNGFSAPLLTGSAQLHNVAAQMKGVVAPVQVSSAALVLTENRVSVQKLAAALGGTGISFTGSLELARGCDPLPSCPATFDLHAGTVALDELNRVLNPQLRPKSWFLLGPPAFESNLSQLKAQGTIAVDRLLIKSVAATRVEARVQIAGARVDLTHVQAQLLGGRHRGEWHADFTGRVPMYSGSGSVEGASLAEVALAMRDPWAAGTAGGSYRLTLSGWSAPELVSSLAGSMDFEWRGGVLRHLVLGGARDPVRFQRFAGHALLRDSTFTLSGCRLETPQGSFTVSGTASLGRQLELRLGRERGPGYSVSGSLARPRVKPSSPPAAQAELRP